MGPWPENRGREGGTPWARGLKTRGGGILGILGRLKVFWGPSWGHLGAVLGPHWGNLVAKCGSRGSVAAIKCNKVKMHILHHVLFIFELVMPPDK